ncbi:hypothetical protein ACWDRX_34735, partial [Streptomyces nigra]
AGDLLYIPLFHPHWGTSTGRSLSLTMTCNLGGWASPSLVGAALAVAGLGLAFAGGAMERRDGRTASSEVITSSAAETRAEAAPTHQA